MIRCAYWPDDSRGQLFVIAFDTNDDLISMKSAIGNLDAINQPLRLSALPSTQLSDLQEVLIWKGETSFLQVNRSITLLFDKTTIAEVMNKLDQLSAVDIPVHEYVALNPAIDLLLSKGEYSERQFCGHPID